MTRPRSRGLGGARRAGVLAVLTAALAGCPDSVAPGYYGPEDDAGSGGTVSNLGSSGDTSSGATTSGTSSGASSGASSGPPPVADAAGSTPGSGGSGGSAGSSGPCNLTGRWLVALRSVTTALGTSEAAHEWYYYELSQSGTEVTVAKGLVCGKNARGLSAASGNSDFPKTWPAMMTKLTNTGRKGTSSPASGGCQVSFEKSVEVMSATVSYYADSSHALPMSSEQASGSTPGWEDWDNDGQPGYTMSITGLATGQIYMVDRTSYVLSGSIAASPSTFDLLVDWNNDQDVLGVNGPPILSMTAAAVKDGDASHHFATFVRLKDTQATGDDASVCSAIRSLAPTLAPRASDAM